MQYAGTGDGGEEDYGAGGVGSYHVVGAGLGDEEGASQVYVEEGAEEGWGVGLGGDVGAGWGGLVSWR